MILEKFLKFKISHEVNLPKGELFHLHIQKYFA